MKTKFLFLLLLLATALRLAWVLTHEVSPAEAYFWMCAQRPAAAFFDGPPGTALLIRAFGPSLDAARLFWPVLALLTSWSAWILVRRIYDANAAFLAVLLLNALPGFNASAVQAGPLMPALISLFTGWIFARLAWEGRHGAWVVAGLFFAAGTLFRYEVALAPLSLLGAVVSVRRGRNHLAGVMAMSALCAAALYLPLSWNAALEWIPVAGGTLKSAWEFDAARFLRGSGDLFRAFSAPALLVILLSLALLVRSARRHARAGFLLSACAAGWVWAGYLWVFGGQAANAVWIACLPPLAFSASLAAKHPRLIPGWIAVAVLALASAVWLSGPPRGSGWKAVADELHAASRDLPAAEQSGFFIAEDPGLAAILGYHTGGSGPYPAVFVPESPDLSNQFGIWPSYADFVESDRVVDEYFTEQKGVNPFVGRNAVYIGRELPQTVKAAFTDVSLLKKIPGPDGTELSIYLCVGYETLPL